MVYLIALIAAIAGAYVNSRLSPGLRRSLFIAIAVYMIMIVGFRYKVGVDTYSYMEAYRFIPSLGHITSLDDFSQTRYEPGFLFVCSLSKYFTHAFWPVQMMMAIIIVGGVGLFLYRSCANIFIGLAFFIFLQWLYLTVEVMREGAAVAIFLANYKNLKERRWGYYYVGCIGAMMFHYSALITFLMPFAKWLNSKYLFLVLCVCFLAITPLVDRLNQIMNIAAISGRIGYYISGAENLNLNWRIMEFVRTVLPAGAVLYLMHRYKIVSDMRVMLLLQILFCMGAFAIPIIFSRFTNYTSLFVTATAANLVADKRICLWIKAAFIAVIIMSHAYYYYSKAPRWFPYSSIFYPESYPSRGKIYRHDFMPWLKF